MKLHQRISKNLQLRIKIC
uniref:Uncharacterized protein n=1 Tax=Anguilla anguilla TaxID=7936 RepID=A0A0E9XUX3_ANGAN